jgi:hypothetical protein
MVDKIAAASRTQRDDEDTSSASPAYLSTVLEPFSTVVKLAMLAFCPPKTKLTFLDHTIYFVKPSFLQSVARTLYGSSRNDLFYLQNPLLVVTQLYPVTKYPMMLPVYRLAVRGLERLLSSYCDESEGGGGSIVHTTLSFYITILQDGMKGRSFGSLTPVENQEPGDEEEEEEQQEVNGPRKQGQNQHTHRGASDLLQSVRMPLPPNMDQQSKFQDLWSEEEISVISNLIRLLVHAHAKRQHTSVDCYLEAIDQTLLSKQSVIDTLLRAQL